MEDGGVGSGIFEGEMGVGNKHPVGPFNPPGRKYPTTYFVCLLCWLANENGLCIVNSVE